MVAACMAGGMRIEDAAELQLAFPTFTEGVGMAAQMLMRELELRPMPQVWSSLNPSIRCSGEACRITGVFATDQPDPPLPAWANDGRIWPLFRRRFQLRLLRRRPRRRVVGGRAHSGRRKRRRTG